MAAALERVDTRPASTRLDISPAQAEGLSEDLLAEADIVRKPITDGIGRLAVQCFGAFGKGRHAAGLNIVDCFSYAGAKARGEALLFKGDDFGRTD